MAIEPELTTPDPNAALIDVWIIEPHWDSEFDELWTDDESIVVKTIEQIAERLFDTEDEFTISVKRRSMARKRYMEEVEIA